MSATVEKLTGIAGDPVKWLTGWKAKNKKKVIGCVPMHFPEEMVHAAGITRRGSVTTLSPKDWSLVLETDLGSAFYLSRVAIPLMQEKGGAIVFISSQLALVGAREVAAYAAAKGGLISLTKAMAIDHAPGIRVNCICPGAIETPMLLNDLEDRGPEATDAWRARHPLGRFGKPADIAYGALYLCCDESRFVTGSTLVIDGGYTSW